MNLSHLALQRISTQGLAHSPYQTPADTLAWMLAVQGQDYLGGKWSLGLRSAGSKDANVEHAFKTREIVRTWALRGTLHFVAAADLRWLIALVGPLVIARNARRYRELELDEAVLQRSSAALARALENSAELSRPALLAILEQQGISTQGQRGVYMLQRASMEGMICQGAAPRNQPTFYLVEKALPPAGSIDRDEALAELAKRYFMSRGPATIEDFIWWSGLPAAQARQGTDASRPVLIAENANGRTYWSSPSEKPLPECSPHVLLLPGFDEFLLCYKDRTAMLDPAAIRALTPSNGMPPATLVIDGRVAGTWKRTLNKQDVSIAINPFRELTPDESAALSQAARRYGEFLGKMAVLAV